MDHTQLYQQLIISAVLVASTTFVHGVFVAAAAAILRTTRGRVYGVFRFFRDSVVLVLLILWLMIAHILEMAMWAFTYRRYELFENFETAFYFSSASYTTLGFGDVLLPEAWRLLAGATAANGFLLFGLSAAFLFDAAGQLRLAGVNRE